MGNILTRKRGKTWEYSFEIESDGRKRKRISKSGFTTKALALSAGTKAKYEYESDKFAFYISDIIFKDFIPDWWNTYIEHQLKDSTKLRYKYILNKRILPFWGDLKLTEISRATLNKYFNECALTTTSIALQYDHRILVSIFKAATEFEYINKNLVSGIKIPKAKESKKIERLAIKPNELNSLISKLHPDEQFLCKLLYYTGMRKGEAFGLTWDCIDFNNHEIIIKFNCVYQKKLSRKLNSPKTKSSIRKIKINKYLEDLLQDKRNKTKHFFYEKKDDTTYVPSDNIEGIEFVVSYSETGIPINFNGITKKLCDVGLNCHSFRHSYATMLIEAGANIKAVQTQLGHTNASTTINTYTHITEKMQNEVVTILDNCLQQDRNVDI